MTAQRSGSWNLTLFGYTEHEETHVADKGFVGVRIVRSESRMAEHAIAA
jgi:hypothetical protein